MQVTMKDSNKSIDLTKAEYKVLVKAFRIVEQGAFHFRNHPENEFEKASIALEEIILGYAYASDIGVYVAEDGLVKEPSDEA